MNNLSKCARLEFDVGVWVFNPWITLPYAECKHQSQGLQPHEGAQGGEGFVNLGEFVNNIKRKSS